MALSVFVRVVEQGGFTAAAGKLGLSPSAVTKTIARLEDALGTQLFTRTTRRLRPTDYGQEFYERSLRILAELEDAEAMLRRGSGTARGRIRAVLPLSFGRVTLAPELPRFFARYPGITLDLHFSDGMVDLIAEGYDLAVRTGHIADSRLTIRLLTRGRQVTVASPAYLARHGEPATPEALREHNCLISRFGPEWGFKGEDGKPFSIRVKGNAVINSGDALREAAVAGTGIAQGTWWLYRKDLERGDVREILRDFALEGAPVSVLYPAQRHVPAKLRAFIDFLVEITRTA
ncbi:LysR family transcriptional regulator [Siccirubricoccus sp. KC 17139]|uniref:LysR family transcriptional regulator n=1 Tax=Siccirubricoccus soli TaxID=2899147 RepID=A0ABT1DAB0_9PROT|nr:LysR family transcriptional regulator [Siccirubricoccus soli]MCO6418846.1 LysR family transcriptional regulator [Siccirubricoccus soli]MCP2684981.1 LysR family transcriptional regulator [Siccirubricoccus soli]